MASNARNYSGQKKTSGFNERSYMEKEKTREITEQNYVDEAEKVILEIQAMKEGGKKNVEITTSKLRNLLAMTADIYNVVMHQNSDVLTEEIKARIEYLRVHFLYESGREESVKTLVKLAGLLEMLKNVKGSKKKYILFNQYMEALVAFHRYYGGRDI